MYCKNCGTDVPEGQLFCTNCGMSVNQENNETSQGKARLVDGSAGNQSGKKYKSKLEELRAQNAERDLEFARKNPKMLRVMSLAGSLIMFISLWLPLITEKRKAITLNSLSTGKADTQKISYSLWELFSRNEVVVYFLLICIIFTALFGALKKYLPAMIFGVIGILPAIISTIVWAYAIYAVIKHEISYVAMSISVATFTLYLGFACIFSAWKLTHELKKRTNN